MERKASVVIIGAGSAGLSALRQVKAHTEDYVLIDHGPLGTKCARIGCMPSKALIIAANDFHRRHALDKEGIIGGDNLRADTGTVMRNVRSLRDYFAGQMAETTKRLAGDRLITGRAEIVAPDNVRVNDDRIKTDCIIIATGARPKVPHSWQGLGDSLVTSDSIFEQQDLPRRIVVAGLGPIGLELGLALSRLGGEVTGFDMGQSIGGATDPEVNAKAIMILSRKFAVHLGASVEFEKSDGAVLARSAAGEFTADAVLAATGVTPDVEGLGLENLGVELNEMDVPVFDACTGQVGDLPVFIAGDVDRCRPILHEAVDEGFIAGRNASSRKIETYCRRTPLIIVFTEPQMATAGLSYEKVKNSGRSFIIGKADFAEQSRAILEQRNEGVIRIYVGTESARLLGAELVCPYAEHIAHMLVLAMEHHLTVPEMLRMPFYHPTVEEGLRTALSDAAQKLGSKSGMQELSLCASCPEPPLC